MKNYFQFALFLAFAAASLPSFAHDPKLHKQEGAAAPDCTQMKDMDMNKMDRNDPVMKAMHEKCKGHMDHENMKNGDQQSHDMKDMPDMNQKTRPSTDKDKK